MEYTFWFIPIGSVDLKQTSYVMYLDIALLLGINVLY